MSSPEPEQEPSLAALIAELQRHLWWQVEAGPLLVDRAQAAQPVAIARPATPPSAPAAAPRPAQRPESSVSVYYQAARIPPGKVNGHSAPLPRQAKAEIIAPPAVRPPGPPVQAPPAGATVLEPKPLDEIRRELGDCRRCKLCEGRKQIVFGSGNPRAKLVFVGEGPGADEDAQGLPFVGKAGQLLTKMIEAMGFTRDEVYICNVVKCRPPANRNPEPDEIAACEPFLRQQLASIQPQVIVALGKFAAQTLLRDSTPITRLRGSWREYQGIRLMPTFHPAYLLRNPADKKLAWADLQKVMALFKERAGS